MAASLGIWLGCIACVVTFFILSYIVHTQRKRYVPIENHTNSVAPKLLNLWYAVTLIILVILPLLQLFSYLLTICSYGHWIWTTLYGASGFTLTFYQIARLYYCFASKQVHSAKYGYSNHTFIFLYAIGIVLAIAYIFVVSAFYFVTDQAEIDIVNNNQCLVTYANEGGELLLDIFQLLGMAYYLWDWTVLFLYMFKVFQVFIFITKSIAISCCLSLCRFIDDWVMHQMSLERIRIKEY